MTVWIPVGFLVAAQAFVVFMFVRNRRVYDFQMRLIEQVSVAARRDIEMGMDFQWRYDTFRTVPYEHMLYTFWRPLDSFYDDWSFVEVAAQ